MPKTIQNWYPNFEPSVSFEVKNAVRRAFDILYQLRDALGPLTLWARGTGSQEIDTMPLAVNGCALTLPRQGQWLVTGCFTIVIDGDAGQLFSGTLNRRGNSPAPQEKAQLVAGTTATVTQQWLIAADQGDSVNLLIVKDGGGGTSAIDGLNTTISATWAGE